MMVMRPLLRPWCPEGARAVQAAVIPTSWGGAGGTGEREGKGRTQKTIRRNQPARSGAKPEPDTSYLSIKETEPLGH